MCQKYFPGNNQKEIEHIQLSIFDIKLKYRKTPFFSRDVEVLGLPNYKGCIGKL